MRRVATVALITGAALLSFAAPAAAIESFFDVFTEVPCIGVTPSAAHIQGIGHMSGGAFHLDLMENTILRNVGFNDSGGTHPPMEGRSLNGLPPGVPWTESFFDIYYRIDMAPGQPTWSPDSFFDIFYELDMPGAGPAQLVPLHPLLPPNDPMSFFDIFVGDSFFDIYYRVGVGPGGGCQELHCHGECPPGYHPVNMSVQIPSAPSSFFDVFFELTSDPGASLPSDQKVLRITTTGEYLTGPVAVQAVTWGTVKSLYR